MQNPEHSKSNPNRPPNKPTIYDELAAIAKQQREAAELQAKFEAEQASQQARPVASELDIDELPELDAEQLSENEKYLADLMHHMKSQQPEIYREALDLVVAEKNQNSTEPVSSEDLDIELEERISKRNNIPADLLAEMTDQMRAEEVDTTSGVWKEVNASGVVGDIARRWRDMYQRALQEVLR